MGGECGTEYGFSPCDMAMPKDRDITEDLKEQYDSIERRIVDVADEVSSSMLILTA